MPIRKCLVNNDYLVFEQYQSWSNNTASCINAVGSYTVQENDENTVKKSKPPVKVSKSSKIPKPNNQKPNGLNVSYQNDDSIPDISDLVADLILPRPNRNPVKHRKLVESSIETSPDESKVKKSKLSNLGVIGLKSCASKF